MTTEEKAKFKIGDKIRHKVHTEITADIIDIREGEYILRNSNGTHLPVEWQDCYELAESEDEKIRKFIIDCIEELRMANQDNANFNGVCSEAIAYLEKQKEREIVPTTSLDAIARDYTNLVKAINPEPTWDLIHTAVCYGYGAGLNVQTPLEVIAKEVTKDKESAIAFLKSAGIMDEDGNLAEPYRTEKEPEKESWPNLSNCKHDCKSCQGKCWYRKEPYQEQKSPDFYDNVSFPFFARSKSTGKIVTIIDGQWDSSTKNYISYSSDREDGFNAYSPEDLVRVEPIDWTPEDERMLSRCIKSVLWGKTFSKSETLNEAKDKEAEWLQSRFPHLNYWKPSEEQMLALGGCLDYLEESGNEDAEVIESLMDDLKKL